jgi:hypothetical protein
LCCYGGDVSGIVTVTEEREKMTNREWAGIARELAGIYEQAEEGIARPIMGVFVWSKEELVRVVRLVGGKWKKIAEDSSEQMRLESEKVKGFVVHIPRHVVCRKVVTWDCEPLMRDEELKEVLEEGE